MKALALKLSDSQVRRVEKRVHICSQQKGHKKVAMFVFWKMPLASQNEASFWAEKHPTEKGTRHPLQSQKGLGCKSLWYPHLGQFFQVSPQRRTSLLH